MNMYKFLVLIGHSCFFFVFFFTAEITNGGTTFRSVNCSGDHGINQCTECRKVGQKILKWVDTPSTSNMSRGSEGSIIKAAQLVKVYKLRHVYNCVLFLVDRYCS